ncbi:NAD(P)-dependent oxidoreductase [Flavobacterium sp. MK4S-17]|uniref:NAD(P)-dependent oxidoreductase n=1 Tax=Flavobacterium sp. MK4S-17 TaxID=2543737 RepID=UPI00135A2A88|nr:NAD(P)-dependent oxidoreductase [Flavobacterium sp. MK4S-17]
MKIAVIGATGFVGSAIVKELVNRNHEVTAIARTPKKEIAEKANWIAADVFYPTELAEVLKGQDIVISSYNPGWTNPNIYDDYLAGAQSIQEAVKEAGVNRFIVIGGAGSLYVAPDLQLIDTPKFPEEYKPGATAVREYLNILKKEQELDWAFFSPAIEMHQGITTGRTGKYRLGTDSPVFDENHRNSLSVEDVAVVIADEAENPKHHKMRFTAGY